MDVNPIETPIIIIDYENQKKYSMDLDIEKLAP
jgi:hypothetical protein